MFDRSRVGTVDFDEFVSLWNYITSWLSCFQSFDLDRSGAIDKRELSEALTRFGAYGGRSCLANSLGGPCELLVASVHRLPAERANDDHAASEV